MNLLLTRDALGIALGLVFLAFGVVLLYDGVTTADVTQTANIIGGAALLSFGLIVLRAVLKNWWKWRKVLRDSRNA
jgi:cytochrome c biogenesis protein CcdA